MTRVSNNAEVHEIKEHIHSESIVYPVNAATPVNLADGGAPNTPGAWTQIIAAGTLSGSWDIHFATLRNFSANGTFIIEFGVGATPDAFGECVVERSAANTDVSDVPVLTGRSDHSLGLASERLVARVRTAAGGKNVDIFVVVHVY